VIVLEYADGSYAFDTMADVACPERLKPVKAPERVACWRAVHRTVASSSALSTGARNSLEPHEATGIADGFVTTALSEPPVNWIVFDGSEIAPPSISDFRNAEDDPARCREAVSKRTVLPNLAGDSQRDPRHSVRKYRDDEHQSQA